MYSYYTPQKIRRNPTDYISHYYTPQPKKQKHYKPVAPFAVNETPRERRRSSHDNYSKPIRKRSRGYTPPQRIRRNTDPIYPPPSDTTESSLGKPPPGIKYMFYGKKQWKSKKRNEDHRKFSFKEDILRQMDEHSSRKELRKLREEERERKEDEDIEKYWEMVRERELQTQPFLRRRGIFGALPPKQSGRTEGGLAPRGAFTYSEPTRVADKVVRWQKQNDFKESLDKQLRLKNMRLKMEEDEEKRKDEMEENALRRFHNITVPRKKVHYQTQNERTNISKNNFNTTIQNQQQQMQTQMQPPPQQQQQQIQQQQLVPGPYNNIYKNLLYQQKQDIMRETTQKQVEFMAPLLDFFKETVKNFALGHISKAYEIKGKELRDELKTTIKSFIVNQQQRLNAQQKKFETLVLEREILGWGNDKDCYKVTYEPDLEPIKISKNRARKGRRRKTNFRRFSRSRNNNNNNKYVVKNSDFNSIDDDNLTTIDDSFLEDIVDDTISVITNSNTSYIGSSYSSKSGNKELKNESKHLYPIVKKVGNMIGKKFIKKSRRNRKGRPRNRGNVQKKMRDREDKLNKILNIGDRNMKDKSINEYIEDLPQLWD